MDVELHDVIVQMGSCMLVGVHRGFQVVLRGDYYVVVDHDAGCRMLYDYFLGSKVHDLSGWHVDHVVDTMVHSTHLCHSCRDSNGLRAHINHCDSVHDPQKGEGGNDNTDHLGDIDYRVDGAPCLVGKLLVAVVGLPMSGCRRGVFTEVIHLEEVGLPEARFGVQGPWSLDSICCIHNFPLCALGNGKPGGAVVPGNRGPAEIVFPRR